MSAPEQTLTQKADPADGTYLWFILGAFALIAVGVLLSSFAFLEMSGWQHKHSRGDWAISCFAVAFFGGALGVAHRAGTVARHKRQAFAERGKRGLDLYRFQSKKNLLRAMASEFISADGGRWVENTSGELRWIKDGEQWWW